MENLRIGGRREGGGIEREIERERERESNLPGCLLAFTNLTVSSEMQA